MDLVEFLRARLDEDEAAARAAKPGPWTRDGGSIYAGHPTEDVVDWVYDDSWEHIVSHDPARVLAEVDAKRWIVDAYERAYYGDGIDENPYEHGRRVALEEACQALALPGANHPDYDESWRP